VAPPKKIQGKVRTIAVKIDDEKYRQSTAIAALRGETVSEIVRDCIDAYIDGHRDLLPVSAGGGQ
jgi:predicted DNA-binding protein